MLQDDKMAAAAELENLSRSRRTYSSKAKVAQSQPAMVASSSQMQSED